MLRLEEYVLRHLDHENIARLFAVYETRKSVNFVLEKCEKGDLIDLIVSKGGRLKEKMAKTVFRQLAQALQHIHSRGFAHCDLKPSNILFGCDHKLKLIDFGVSQRIHHNQALHLEVGSPSFMAPEVISGCYTENCDMWSLGVCVFVSLYGFNPWNPVSFAFWGIYSAFLLTGFCFSVPSNVQLYIAEFVPGFCEVSNLLQRMVLVRSSLTPFKSLTKRKT